MPAKSRAYYSEKERWLDGTAYNLRRGWGTNLECKYTFYDKKGLTLSLSTAMVFGNLEASGVHVRMIDIPSTFTASYQINETSSTHGGITGPYANVLETRTPMTTRFRERWWRATSSSF